MVAPEVMAHRLLRGTVDHLQVRMACRETQLEARAEDMRDPVTKRVEMTLIRYSLQVTRMEVPSQTGDYSCQTKREMRRDKRAMNKGSA